jgi:hypothetical protein
MGVHLAIGEPARPSEAGARRPRQADRGVAPSRGQEGTSTSGWPMQDTRDPLTSEMAHLVQLAVALTAGDRRTATETRDALRSSRAPHVNVRPAPADVAKRVDAFRAFMTRPMCLLPRALALLLVCSMGAGTMFATADALPGDPLHDVKIATEQLRVTFARSPENRIAVELSIAGSRLREAAALEGQGREASAQAAISAYGEHIALAAATVEELPPSGSAAALDRLRTQVLDQERSLPRADAVAFVAQGIPTGVQAASAAVAAAAVGEGASADRIASSAAAVSVDAAASVALPASTAPGAPSNAPAVELPIAAGTPTASRPIADAPTEAAGSRTTAPSAGAPTASVPTVRATAPGATAPKATPPAATASPVVAPPPARVVDDATTVAAKAAEESATRAQDAAKRAQNAAANNAKTAKDAPKK